MDNIFISLSSNQNNPAGQLQTAIQKITEAGIIIKNKSHVYETEPWGMPNQDWFLNQIIELTNQDSPQKLLIKLQKIEDEMGRVRASKYGPRIIDLDIVYFHDQIINESNLQIPHPHRLNRNFILIPLNEIAPNFIDPETKTTIQHLLSKCSDTNKVNLIQNND